MNLLIAQSGATGQRGAEQDEAANDQMVEEVDLAWQKSRDVLQKVLDTASLGQKRFVGKQLSERKQTKRKKKQSSRICSSLPGAVIKDTCGCFLL